MRVLVRLLIGAVLLVSALVVLAFVAVGNETASAWLLRQGARSVPGELRLENLSGDLVSGIRAGQLRYESDGVQFDASNASVEVRWAALLERRLTISQLSVSTVKIVLVPSEAESGGFELPEIDLPLAVEIDEATAGRLEIATGDTEEVIEDLRVRAALNGSALRIGVVEAVTRGFGIELGGDATLTGAYPLKAAVEWQQLDGPLSGAGQFAGDLEALAFMHELRLPDTIAVNGTMRHLITAPQLQLDATWEQVAWPVEDFGKVISRNGRVVVDGTFAAYLLEFSAAMQSPGVPDLMIELAAQGQEMQVQIDALRVLGMGGELTGSGRVDVTGPSIAMRITGAGLDPSYLRADLRGDLNFVADVEGDLPDPVLVRVERLDGELLGQPLAGSGEVLAAGERLELRQVKLQSGENRLSFDGALRPALSGQFMIDAPALDVLWPELGGRIAGEGSVGGTLAAPLVTVALRGTDLVFQDQSFESLRLDGKIDATRRLDWTLEARGLRSGETPLGELTARATGELSAHRIQLALTDGPVAIRLDSSGRWDGATLRQVIENGAVDAGEAGSWNLRAPVAVSLAQGRGALEAHCWEGSLGLLCVEQSSFSAERIATAARLTDFPLAALAPLAGEGFEIFGTADAELAIARQADELSARLSWVQADTRIVYRQSERPTIESEFSEVRVLVDATQAMANLDARVRGDYGLEVDAVGTLSEPMMDKGELDVRVKMQVPELAETAPLVNRFLPLSSLGGALRGDLHVTGPRVAPVIEGEARLTDFPLASLAPLAGEGVEIFGTADAQLAVAREDDVLTAHLKWEQSETRIVYRESERSTIESDFSEVRVLVDATEAMANLDARVRGDYGLQVDVAGTLTEPMTDKGELDVRLAARVPELGETMPLLSRFLPLSSVRGALQADLHIAGTRVTPVIEGEARLTNGFASVPQAGIDVEEIDMALVGRNGAPLAITGSARSGDGRLQLAGEIQWSDIAGAFAEVNVTGQEFQVIRFPDQTVQISPDMRARIDNQRVAVSGRIEVPRARIVVEALPETASAPSADVVVHETAEARESAQPYQLFGDLEVSLGSDVYFTGFGIDTRLAGGLKLARPPRAGAVSAEGALRTVDGKFAAYGKELSIERGSLIFAGPLDDPNVDARATRKLRYDGKDITTGVMLSGRLSNMQTRVFSEPTMSEADALSFLVLDRPIRRAEGDDAELVSGAAIAMGLAQALPITQSLQETTGLDEVGFEKSQDDDTAVVAGKRLSEDVYVRYSYGLFNRIGTFIVRYRIGGGFEIEAGSGQEQTLDLIYSTNR
jgi:translocation and assembly module TamB